MDYPLAPLKIIFLFSMLEVSSQKWVLNRDFMGKVCVKKHIFAWLLGHDVDGPILNPFEMYSVKIVGSYQVS